MFVDDRHFGPVQERYHVTVGLVQEILVRVQIYGQSLGVRVQIQSGLDVRQVQSVAHGMHVRSQVTVGGTEKGRNAEIELVTRYDTYSDIINTLWRKCVVILTRICFSGRVLTIRVTRHCNANNYYACLIIFTSTNSNKVTLVQTYASIYVRISY